VFFRVGSSVLLCFIAEKTRADTYLPPHYGQGQLHLAFEVSPVEYDEWKTTILKKGIKIIHEQSWRGNLHSFYFRDFDGNLLEVVPSGMWD